MGSFAKSSANLNSKAVANAILEDHGELKAQIEWSKDKDKDGQTFKSNFININNRGELTCADQILVKNLLSCFLRVVDNGVIYVESFDNEDCIFLKTLERDIFIKLFSALLYWQGLKPRGIANKKLTKSFSSEKLNDDGTLLVASCKIYSHVPKSKNLDLVNGPEVTLYDEPSAGWFTAMVILKSHGILHFINENDGQPLYTIDIKKLRRSEIRELHHSIFESSNYLFVGVIEGLRKEIHFRNQYDYGQLIPTLSKEYPKIKKIILEFPYRIDLEDWLVALTSFTQREYAGFDKKNCLRISRKVNLSILEAEFDSTLQNKNEFYGLYAEVQIWGMPWFRTAVVENSLNPFFREEFELDLTITTASAKVVLREAKEQYYSTSDVILGELDLSFKTSQNLKKQDRFPLILANQQVGQIFLGYNIQTNYILPPENFNNIEQMILNLDLKQLLKKVLSNTSQSNLKSTSVILLDIFQSLQKENEWFGALIEEEVNSALSSKDFKKVDGKGNELCNVLFRGNSLLTKSLELFNLRSGQEYLEKVIGDFIVQIVQGNVPTEIDPNRIRIDDVELKEKTIESNFKILLKYVEEVWTRIYTSSNDLPNAIKQQLTLLRKKIELYTIDSTIALNAISSFIFLRFFCPVILNPKLFFLTKDHQTGDIKRTLTLISKILMTFANRSEFNVKEPYLMKFNDSFIKLRRDELLDYLDKITGKKLDFTERKLKLSHFMERTDLVLTSKSLLKELPTIPFLIDKYLRMDQLVDLVADEKIDLANIDDFGLNFNENQQSSKTNDHEAPHRIGDLEFEKIKKTNSKNSDFEFGSEKFIKKLLDTNESEEVFNYINSESCLKDIVAEATLISNKKAGLIRKLSGAESINDIQEMANYIQAVLSTTIVDDQKNIMKVTEKIPNLKYLKTDSSYNSLKIKLGNSLFGDSDTFSLSSRLSTSPTKIRITQMLKPTGGSSNSLGSTYEGIKRNPEGQKKRLSGFGRLFHKS